MTRIPVAYTKVRKRMTINNNRVSFAFADNKEDGDQQQPRFLWLILRGGTE